MDQSYLQQKQPTLQQLAKSVRPRTPQTVYNTPIMPEIFVLNGRLLERPLVNVDFLANYLIFSDIASGSYGQTFLAKDMNGQTLAVKKLTSHIRQHVQEGRFLAQLHSATIPKVHSCFIQSNSLYIVEEAGEISLEELLSFYVQLPESLIWTIAADCLNSIVCCHEKQLAHLDIKPANVLVFKNDYFRCETSQTDQMREAVNQTPDCMSFSNAGLLAASQLHFSQFNQNQMQMNDPLQKLHLQIGQLSEKATFMLIDFGNAQKTPFTHDTSCGDARYLYSNFLQTSVPSFKCDLFSLGVMLYECLSGVVLPTCGELFERLRMPSGIFNVCRQGPMFQQRFNNGDLLIALIYELLYGTKDAAQVQQQWHQCFPQRNYAQIIKFRQYNDFVVQVQGSVNKRAKKLRKTLRHLQKQQISPELFIRLGGLMPFFHFKNDSVWCSRLRIVKQKPVSPALPLNYFAENSDSDDRPIKSFFPVQEGRLNDMHPEPNSTDYNIDRLDAGVFDENDGIAELKNAVQFDRSCSEAIGFQLLHGSSPRIDMGSARLATQFQLHNDVTSEITYAEAAKPQVKSAYDDQSVILSTGKENLALSIETSTNSYVEYDSGDQAQSTSSSSFSLNMQYQLFTKPVEFFLSSLELFSGIASMIYVYPLKKYHPTPTTVLSGGEDLEEKSDSDLNKQKIKASFRPSSGSLNVLSQSELLRQGYQSVNNVYVDCFEKKSQNNSFLQYLHHHRLIMFMVLNFFFVFLRLRKRSKLEKVLQSLLILGYAAILQRLNKHNLELNYDTKYSQIHYTNIYVDPIKAKSCFMGFIVPVIFTLQNCVQFDYTSKRKVCMSLSLFGLQLVIIRMHGVF